MTKKERFFKAFKILEKAGVRLRDITWGQMTRETGYALDQSPELRHQFHQYRYLYKKEKGK